MEDVIITVITLLDPTTAHATLGSCWMRTTMGVLVRQLQCTDCCLLLLLNVMFQIMMNVPLTMTTVTNTVTTHTAHTSVPVTVGGVWTLMDTLAMVNLSIICHFV